MTNEMENKMTNMEPEHMYYVSHRKLGYNVMVTYSLENARMEKQGLGRSFGIYDENGKEIK